MAIVQVQVSPATLAVASAPAVTSFAVLPSAGALIRVAVAMNAGLGQENVSIADNQGNTYIKAADSGNSNDLKSQIWYAYDIPAPSGTFTVTATALGANQSTIVQAKEAIGFTAGVDPLNGTAISVGNAFVNPVGPTAPVVVADTLVDAVILSYAVPTVEVVVPPWIVDDATGTWQTDSRLVTDVGGQSCSWSVAFPGTNWAAVIVAFAANPPTPEARWTQAARHVMWVDDPTENRLTQMARHVMYPFTCVPGPAPPSAAGCPQGVFPLPVVGRAGCDDEV